jgi:uncharacterized protein with GYD domain
MAIYIQLLTLSPEGREKALADPESILRAQGAISVQGVQVLGIYSVLGECDFVNIVEASDNTAMARFSIELGVRAGAHITTMPAIPIGRMEEGQRSAALEAEAAT